MTALDHDLTTTGAKAQQRETITCKGCGRPASPEIGLCARCQGYLRTAHPRQGRSWDHMVDVPGWRG